MPTSIFQEASVPLSHKTSPKYFFLRRTSHNIFISNLWSQALYSRVSRRLHFWKEDSSSRFCHTIFILPSFPLYFPPQPRPFALFAGLLRRSGRRCCSVSPLQFSLLFAWTLARRDNRPDLCTDDRKQIDGPSAAAKSTSSPPPQLCLYFRLLFVPTLTVHVSSQLVIYRCLHCFQCACYRHFMWSRTSISISKSNATQVPVSSPSSSLFACHQPALTDSQSWNLIPSPVSHRDGFCSTIRKRLQCRNRRRAWLFDPKFRHWGEVRQM